MRYRNFDTSIVQVAGIVLPTFVRQVNSKEQCKENKKKCPVLYITMEWIDEDFRFMSTLKHIDAVTTISTIVKITLPISGILIPASFLGISFQ